MERESSSRISKNGQSPARQGLQVSPSAPAPGFEPRAFELPRSRRTLFVVGLIVLGVAAIVLGGMWIDDFHFGDFYFHDFSFRHVEKAPEAVAAETQVMERFTSLKNAGDSAADELLAPLPAVSLEPISQEEADRFKVNGFLHRNIRIQSVRAVSSHRFLLTTEGNWSAPPLQVRSAHGVDRIQRILFNPDLLVEVRDGIIHGIR
jgi:hypothetical protein